MSSIVLHPYSNLEYISRYNQELLNYLTFTNNQIDRINGITRVRQGIIEQIVKPKLEYKETL